MTSSCPNASSTYSTPYIVNNWCFRALFDLLDQVPAQYKSSTARLAFDGTSATALLVDAATGAVLEDAKLYNEAQDSYAVQHAKVRGRCCTYIPTFIIMDSRRLSMRVLFTPHRGARALARFRSIHHYRLAHVSFQTSSVCLGTLVVSLARIKKIGMKKSGIKKLLTAVEEI
jgi:hypothetical protein